MTTVNVAGQRAELKHWIKSPMYNLYKKYLDSCVGQLRERLGVEFVLGDLESLREAAVRSCEIPLLPGSTGNLVFMQSVVQKSAGNRSVLDKITDTFLERQSLDFTERTKFERFVLVSTNFFRDVPTDVATIKQLITCYIQLILAGFDGSAARLELIKQIKQSVDPTALVLQLFDDLSGDVEVETKRDKTRYYRTNEQPFEEDDFE